MYLGQDLTEKLRLIAEKVFVYCTIPGAADIWMADERLLCGARIHVPEHCFFIQ